MRKTILFAFLLPLGCIAQTKEEWATKPINQWPQIALVNHVQYQNGDRYIDPSFPYAGTGFLIVNRKDTLAATAKHVLWIAKNRQTKFVEINDQLRQWVMKPKGNSRDSVIFDRLLNEDGTEVLNGDNSSILERDWLVFSVKKASPNITPLKPRYSPLKTGEKVYFIGSAYQDSARSIQQGIVLRKLGMDILVARGPDDARPGSSGSAVIDTNGLLVGIMSSAGADSQTGKPVSVVISTEYLRKVLSNRADANAPKKDYGELILQTVLAKGPEKAIRQYQKLERDPGNYYIYNLRSSTRNGLRETGEKLIAMNKIPEAIKILEVNTRVNSSFYLNYNLLAKAYIMAGKKEEAIKNYHISISKFPEKGNEAFKELEKLKGIK